MQQHHLQADLRVCLENPTDANRQALLATLKAMIEGRTEGEDPAVWWMSHLKTSVRLFAQHPTKQGYLSLVRMGNHYLELVSDGIIQPRRVTRSNTFEPNVDYWFQKLGDKMSMVIDRPTELTVRGLKEQLEEYCRLKKVEL